MNATVAALLGDGVPGAAVSARYLGQELLSSGVGVADKATGAAVIDTTLFRIGSVSKLFPVLLLYMYADPAIISRPISTFIPTFRVVNPFDGGQVTLGQLATHMSGMQRETPDGANTTGQVLDILASAAPLIAPPGARPSYSNLGLALLGHLLAEWVYEDGPGVGGLPGLVAKYITGPLGMRDTGYNYTEEVMARLATGYGPDGDAEAWYPFGWDAPAGSMYSTASDLTVLASALMAAAAGEETPLGTHLRPEVARRLLQPHYWNGDGQSWFGSPWETAIDASYSILGKGGHIPGYSALLAFVPDLRLAVALTFNGGADMYGGVTESTVGSLVTALARWLPGVEANPGPYWTDITGAYRDADSGTEALVYRWQAQWLVVDFGVRLASMRLQYVGTPAAAPRVVAGDATLTFRVYVRPGDGSCLAAELQAWDGQYVYFTLNHATGRGTTITTPGLAPGTVWSRIA